MKVAVNVENCEKFAEEFGRALFDAVGWRYWWSGSGLRGNVPKVGDFANVNIQLKQILNASNIVHEAEKTVIEKVGEDDYGRELSKIFNAEFADLWRTDDIKRMFAKIATALASQRLTAMLLTLGIEQVEVGE